MRLTSTSSGLHSPRAAMRRLVAEIRSVDAADVLGGDRTEQARREGGLRRGEAGGLRGADREQAVSRFAGSPPGLIPGIGPKTAARLADMGLPTLAALAAAPEQLLVERFGPNHGRELIRKARFEHDGAVGAPRKAVSESRERDVRPRHLRSLGARAGARADGGRAVREPREHAAGAGARSRSRSAWTTSRRSPARIPSRAPTCNAETVAAVALRLLEEYAPARPVRLLGVRMAATRPSPGSPAAMPGGAGGAESALRWTAWRTGGAGAAERHWRCRSEQRRRAGAGGTIGRCL